MTSLLIFCVFSFWNSYELDKESPVCLSIDLPFLLYFPFPWGFSFCFFFLFVFLYFLGDLLNFLFQPS